MIIPDDVRKCVAFVGYRDSNAMFKLAGTTFFLGRTIGATGRAFHYAVTAKHVIDGIRGKGCNRVLVRLNLTNGNASWVDTDIQDWLFHPDDTEVDVAVLRASIPDDVDHLVYPIDRVATEEVIAREGIGVGEEVFLTGLFVHHYGKQRNIPIVRVGNIAAMPEEKVETQFGLIDAYLVEARSIGGLSGSPVFVHLGLVRHIEGQVKFSTSSSGIFYMLGLMHGHFAAFSSDMDVTLEDSLNRERINMGIGIVVPISKILEVLTQPEIRKAERQVEVALEKQSSLENK